MVAFDKQASLSALRADSVLCLLSPGSVRVPLSVGAGRLYTHMPTREAPGAEIAAADADTSDPDLIVTMASWERWNTHFSTSVSIEVCG